MDNNKVQDITKKMSMLINRLRSFDDEHEKALEEMLDKYEIAELLNKNLTLSEVHVIDCIGKNKFSNTTFISKELNMTKGAISKITTKLLDKDLIKSDKLESNKKEVYYILTKLGREIFFIHEKIHKAQNEKFEDMISKYSTEELVAINKFLDDLTNNI
ncbi:MarR family transcriptional regulator [Clostridium intestinale]|uniref:Transcriptional regulator, MarR family n=1 Tax=Clostridium intestinale DSM 6191 TaxID=1121320 RepID=A0A1M5VYT9_9CLOT|nr:MarR family transcriptional regulator [Clostridium intestinale]SHH80489.1 transcriptional regulator, MarR family [Clostridium intestinale DSM 6191]